MPPVVPGKKLTGTNTATSTIEMATTAPVTSAMLRLAASKGESRSVWISRSMFSITTMASSTTRPVARVSPNRVRVLIENPKAATKAKVPTSDTGRVTATITRLRPPCRNRKITSTTRAMASNRVVSTSLTEASMARVLSLTGLELQAGGEVAAQPGQLGHHAVAHVEGVGGRAAAGCRGPPRGAR